MQYDKEFHLYWSSWDVDRKGVERGRESRVVCVYVCALVKQGPIFSILPPTAS